MTNITSLASKSLESRLRQRAPDDPARLTRLRGVLGLRASAEGLVDVAFERKLERVIPLEEIKQHTDALGEGFPLTARGSRLSVFPVTAAQWKLLLSLE